MLRPAQWSIADVLDFEYLLATEAGAETTPQLEQNRALFAAKVAPQLAAEQAQDRRWVFQKWLEARREKDRAALPGAHFLAGWQTLLTLAAFAGLLIGVSLTAGLLHYKGDEPVNVAWFFAWTVGLQLVLLLAALGVWLVRRCTRVFDDFGPVRWLLAALLWSLSAGLRRLPGPQRDQLRAGIARISHRREIYGSLAAWPLLSVTQLFGVSFNLGVLATLLLHVALSDVAFGWQSTLHTSPEEAHRITTAVAAPWAWAPNPHPTLAQVVASRFSYSEGIRPLSAEAMAAWWPFLCYAVVCYGLLIRGALLLWSMLALRRSLRRLTFTHQECNTLFRRLTGPVMQAQGGTALLEIPEIPALDTPHLASGRSLVLLASDLTIAEAELHAQLQAAYRWEVAQMLTVQIDHPSGNAAALATLEQMRAELVSVVIVVRAKRSPIRAIALFVQKVVAAAGGGPEVLLLLTGRREGEAFAPVSDEEFGHWRNFNAIHGLHVGVERWRTE